MRRASGSRVRTVIGSALLAAAAAVAVMLIVSGSTSAPPAGASRAPLPAKDFAMTSVPDPTIGALPFIEETAPVSATSAHSAAADPAQRSQQPAAAVQDERLIVPALGVDASIVAHPLVDGSLVLPDAVNTLTLWDGSAPITARTGTMLVAGHVDNRTQGAGALYWIHTLQPGDVLYLTHRGVVTRWKTVELRSYLKQALPQSVWAGTAGARKLVVVTCGGAFRDGHYDDNVVLTAVPFDQGP